MQPGPTPTFYEFFLGVKLAFTEFGFDWEKYPVDYNFLIARFTDYGAKELGAVFGAALFLTVIRYAITKLFSLPIGRFLLLRDSDLIKFSESVWKLFIYSVLWGYSLYVVILSGRYNFFHDPCLMWDFNSNHTERIMEPVPVDMALLYIWQVGFYFHCLYATLYMDVWRKDSLMMMLHHCLTIFLLYFSFSMRYYKVGTMVLLLHDISDVLLEVTKINVYLKTRGGNFYRIHDMLSTIGFGLFSASWAFCRLYWFPLKVLHSTNWCVYKLHRGHDPKMFLVCNIMLFLLQLLNIYWFYFIVVFLIRVATGKTKEVEDTREYEEDTAEDGVVKQKEKKTQ